MTSGLLSAKTLGFKHCSFVKARALERLPSPGVIQTSLLATALAIQAMALAPDFILLLVILFLLGFFRAATF